MSSSKIPPPLHRHPILTKRYITPSRNNFISSLHTQSIYLHTHNNNSVPSRNHRNTWHIIIIIRIDTKTHLTKIHNNHSSKKAPPRTIHSTTRTAVKTPTSHKTTNIIQKVIKLSTDPYTHFSLISQLQQTSLSEMKPFSPSSS